MVEEQPTGSEMPFAEAWELNTKAYGPNVGWAVGYPVLGGTLNAGAFANFLYGVTAVERPSRSNVVDDEAGLTGGAAFSLSASYKHASTGIEIGVKAHGYSFPSRDGDAGFPSKDGSYGTNLTESRVALTLKKHFDF